VIYHILLPNDFLTVRLMHIMKHGGRKKGLEWTAVGLACNIGNQRALASYLLLSLPLSSQAFVEGRAR
jgi:hypothetical protein